MVRFQKQLHSDEKQIGCLCSTLRGTTILLVVFCSLVLLFSITLIYQQTICNQFADRATEYPLKPIFFRVSTAVLWKAGWEALTQLLIRVPAHPRRS